MKKLLFVSLLIANFSYAQFKPYILQRKDNTAIFYQMVDQMRNQLTEANNQFSNLQMMLAEYGSQLNNDEATLIWFDQYKRSIINNFNTLREGGFFADALQYAIRMQGEIAINPELMARIRTAKEYQVTIKSINERKDITQEEKRELMLNHPYCFIPILNNDDQVIGGKLGTQEELDAFNMEVERRTKLAEENEKARLYAMSHPFDGFDYSHYDKVIEYPHYIISYDSELYSTLRITRVALSTTETRVEMEWQSSSYNWFNIEHGTYIKAWKTNKMYFVKADNIAISPSVSSFKKPGEILKFALTFPPLPKNVKSFTLAGPRKRDWQFKEIIIQ